MLAKMQDIFYAAATVSVAVLCAFGSKALYNQSQTAKYEAQTIKSVPTDNMYDFIKVNHDILNEICPLDQTSQTFFLYYANKDTNDSENILLSRQELIEFVEHGLTPSLQKKITINNFNSDTNNLPINSTQEIITMSTGILNAIRPLPLYDNPTKMYFWRYADKNTNDDSNILLSRQELIEFVEHGLTPSLQKKIKVIC